MYEKLLNALLSSSLSSIISDHEIEEIAIELEDEIQTIISEKVDEAKEEIEENNSKEIGSVTSKLNYAESELARVKKTFPKMDTLQDVMTMEWVTQNWEDIIRLYDMNVDGHVLVSHIKRKMMWEKVNSLDNQEEKQKLHKRIVLVGRAASGKDFARKLLTDRNFKHAISYTTRPPRTGEVDGVDYYFLSEEKFKQMIDNNEFYEYVSFNNWYYGTSNKQFYQDDVFIMTPYGISKIKPEDRKNTLIIFFDIPYDVRKERLMLRSDADNVERRLQADDLDFKEFTDFDLRITNPEYDERYIDKIIEKYASLQNFKFDKPEDLHW